MRFSHGLMELFAIGDVPPTMMKSNVADMFLGSITTRKLGAQHRTIEQSAIKLLYTAPDKSASTGTETSSDPTSKVSIRRVCRAATRMRLMRTQMTLPLPVPKISFVNQGTNKALYTSTLYDYHCLWLFADANDPCLSILPCAEPFCSSKQRD